ncbi:hypothetical protein [Flavobacterium caeni]|uniref:DUF4468 domain-containing protein n=1 Tax=Flavobacterium caeni TaxID=490189 RepID=A0A1G5AKP8_9FLAO|nr:hypothetical protein [Flavobacterium caeni]SCX78469.1 hypothetical protein SAMN02927903_00043 [Flavobacterium caeni]
MKNMWLSLLFFCYTASIAQTLDALRPMAQKICDANYNMDFEPLADLTYPPLVTELGGREKFLEKVDLDYQNDEFRKRIQLETPALKFAEIKKIDGASYCVITYYNPIRYFIEKKLDAMTGPQKAAELKIIEQATFAVYEPARNTINVKRHSTLVAIADATTQNQWRFINFDDTAQREWSAQHLNENIKKQLGL